LPGTRRLDKLVHNLHRRTEKHRSPTHPKPKGPSEAEGIGVPAGESTGTTDCPPLSTVAETGWEKEKGSKVTGKKEKVGKLGLHENDLVWAETGFNVAWLLNGLICLISKGMDWAIKYGLG